MTAFTQGGHVMRQRANIGLSMLKIASIYMIAGLLLGLFMGISKNFAFTSVHSHVLLLGWVAMAVTGLVYVVLPNCAHSRLAKLHFWGHNLGLPAMTAGLLMLTLGRESGERLIGPGSVIVLLSLGAFAANVFRNGGRELAIERFSSR